MGGGRIYGDMASVPPPRESLIEYRDLAFAEYLALPQDF